VRGGVNLLVDFVRDALQHVAVDHALVDQEFRKAEDGIALRFGGALGGGFVKALVVGKRVRVRPDDMPVHQRRPFGLAAPLRGGFHRAIRGQKIRAVHLLAEQPGKAFDETRNAAARGLRLYGNGDGVAVVFHQKQHWQAAQAGRVQRLPEFALAGGALAARDQCDFASAAAMPRRFRAADCLQELRSGGRGCADDVPPRMTPVRGHLPAARSRIGGRADRLLQHLERRHAQREAQRAVAVVWVDPILAGVERHAGGHLQRFVAGPADLEKNPVLPLQRHLPVVQPAGGVHQAESADELLRCEAFESLVARVFGRRGCNRSHARVLPDNSVARGADMVPTAPCGRGSDARSE
jgi:hypothetical protein